MALLKRSEVASLLLKEMIKIIHGVAWFFILVGSLLSHFVLGENFLSIVFLGTWMMVHGLGLAANFLDVSKQYLMPIASFLGLQLYFWTGYQSISWAFFPMLPVFFVITNVIVGAGGWPKYKTAILLWCASWFSCLYWVVQVHPMMPMAPLLQVIGVNLVLMLLYFSMVYIYQRRVEKKLDLLGPSKDFDPYKIHKERLQVLGELSSSLGHEISTPLVNIDGFCLQIEQDAEHNNLQRILGHNSRIRENLVRLRKIIAAMRNFSRGGVAAEMKELSLKELVDDSVALVMPKMKKEHVDFELQLPSVDVFLYGDRVQLAQVLVNFLNNAVYACKNSERKKIRLGYHQREDYCEIWVEDTGPGVPEEHRKKIYHSFFTTKGMGEGTGLGLSISNKIAEIHKGKIYHDAQTDKNGRILGTRFVLKIASSIQYNEESVKAA